MNIHSLSKKISNLRHQIVNDIHVFLDVSHRPDAHQRSAIRELSAMTDRELHDLGICRSDIGQVVLGIQA